MAGGIGVIACSAAGFALNGPGPSIAPATRVVLPDPAFAVTSVTDWVRFAKSLSVSRVRESNSRDGRGGSSFVRKKKLGCEPGVSATAGIKAFCGGFPGPFGGDISLCLGLVRVGRRLAQGNDIKPRSPERVSKFKPNGKMPASVAVPALINF